MFTESSQEITEIMEENIGLIGKEVKPIVSNHTRYPYREAANFEHDDEGGLMNYLGVEDQVLNAQSEHDGWQDGYDY